MLVGTHTNIVLKVNNIEHVNTLNFTLNLLNYWIVARGLYLTSHHTNVHVWYGAMALGTHVCYVNVKMVANTKGHGNTKQPIICSSILMGMQCIIFYHSKLFVGQRERNYEQKKNTLNTKKQPSQCKYFETKITHQRTFPSFPCFKIIVNKNKNDNTQMIWWALVFKGSQSQSSNIHTYMVMVTNKFNQFYSILTGK